MRRREADRAGITGIIGLTRIKYPENISRLVLIEAIRCRILVHEARAEARCNDVRPHQWPERITKRSRRTAFGGENHDEQLIQVTAQPLEPIGPRWRFIAQGVAALVAIAGGTDITSLGKLLWAADVTMPVWFGVPFTVFALCGVINSLNMIEAPTAAPAATLNPAVFHLPMLP